MRKLHLAMALSLLMASAATSPAWAQADSMDPPRSMSERSVIAVDPDAFDTLQDPLTLTIEEDRLAAVTYMDDALSLLDIAETQLKGEHVEIGRAALVGASGKLTNAYLLNFQDKAFSSRIGPLAMQIDEAIMALAHDPERAVGIISALTPQVASVYQTQVAQMGGGAGAGLEDLDHLQDVESMEMDE